MVRWSDSIGVRCRCTEYIETKKEVKKVKPYLEVKVVKVKKEKKDFWCGGMRIDDKQYKVFKRKKGIPYLKEFKKGNWFNGENLDKIKFPVGCNWHIPLDNDIQYGILMKKNSEIELHHIKQHNYSSIVATGNLKELIKRWDIHILKAKIILFEEEK